MQGTSIRCMHLFDAALMARDSGEFAFVNHQHVDQLEQLTR